MANILIFIRYLVLSKGPCGQYAYIYKVFGVFQGSMMANMLIFIRYLVLSKGECHQYAYIYKVFGALPTDLLPSPRGVNLKKKK